MGHVILKMRGQTQLVPHPWPLIQEHLRPWALPYMLKLAINKQTNKEKANK
jgi:hypothetical protein